MSPNVNRSKHTTGTRIAALLGVIGVGVAASSSKIRGKVGPLAKRYLGNIPRALRDRAKRR